MAYNPAYITFDLNPFDEEATLEEVKENINERFEEELSPLVAGGPVITRPPQDVSGEDGATATFTVTAIGTGTLTYQWQTLFGGAWSNISGATSATYSVTIAPALDGTEYRCVVTDENSIQTASLPATLTVTA